MPQREILATPDRLNEIADILATGLMRLRARQSTSLSGVPGDSSLDCPAQQSSHANPTHGGLA